MIASPSKDFGNAEAMMSGMNPEVVPSAGNSLFVAAIGLFFVVSTAATLYFCLSMGDGMDMPGGWTMSMLWMQMPGQTWLSSAAMLLIMWLAMMLPSAVPMLLAFRGSANVGDNSWPGVPTGLAACSYFAVWMVVGVAVYIAGASWASAAMRWSGLSRAVPALTGAGLILAGASQFTRWKMVGLGHCHNPHAHITTGKGGGLRAGVSYGFRHGVSCVRCCAGPMLALLMVGAMNPLAMLVIAGVISLEKLLPKPRPVIYLTGIVAVGAGIATLLRSVF